jgi:hypothetical protein
MRIAAMDVRLAQTARRTHPSSREADSPSRYRLCSVEVSTAIFAASGWARIHPSGPGAACPAKRKLALLRGSKETLWHRERPGRTLSSPDREYRTDPGVMGTTDGRSIKLDMRW